MIKIFVYGTLRTDMYHYKKYLMNKIIRSELAYVKGSLHEIKGVIYPALVDGDEMIAGEIMEIDDDHIVTLLDELEGFYGAGDVRNEYNKLMMTIYDDRGEVIENLPVYVYNIHNQSYKQQLSLRIMENDYVAYMAKRGNFRIRL